MRGITTFVVMIAVPPDWYSVSTLFSMLDMIRYALFQCCRTILFICRLPLQWFQFVFVSARHAMSICLSWIPLHVASSVWEVVLNSKPLTFWKKILVYWAWGSWRMSSPKCMVLIFGFVFIVLLSVCSIAVSVLVSWFDWKFISVGDVFVIPVNSSFFSFF